VRLKRSHKIWLHSTNDYTFWVGILLSHAAKFLNNSAGFIEI